jgi:lipopolysaccharide export system protein LptA
MTSDCIRRRPVELACAALLIATAALPIHALESDRNQPVGIEAVGSDTDLKSGLMKLTGGVKITQGSLVIESETADIYQTGADSEVSRVVLAGAPATLEQALDNAAGRMRASARTIDYDLSSDSVVLSGAVRIEEPRGTLTGERVTYDITQGRVRGQSGGGDSRVRIVIPPRAKDTDGDPR